MIVKLEVLLKLCIGWFDAGNHLELHLGPIHTILAVTKLEQLLVRVADGPVVVHHQAFHGLDQTTLDIA